ncbi:ethanolamine ammonia-lyase subunit EutC [Ferviditalea candida]|uniref:Ethanolamine ammonia-lyase small subunit n=1 Tax=Ferviditalea candida TaxID=3108399 RepID=A0ABU5ZGI0_9BACL|nr:ethanolamine ammonia-lyase subunit EutC [Paenibacillaceae bacterium T2]
MDTSLNLDELVTKIMQELESRYPSSAAASSLKPEHIAGQRMDQASADQRPEPAAEHHVLQRAEINVPKPKWKEGLLELTASTPARIGVWRTGTRPLTSTQLKLRIDHAAAVDSVYGEVNRSLLDEMGLFTVETQFENTENYLKRPDKGRVLTEEGAALIRQKCAMRPQVQIVVSDGLSANAVEANLRDVYPALLDSLRSHGLSWGTPFFVKGGRVASMDHIGELLQPEALVLLIGERPGLVTSSSMSAYMCYRPRKGIVESDRTVISNIHRGGTPPIEAGAHIGTVLRAMIDQRASGVKLVI